MTISIDEFINNLSKSDYTEFEEKQENFINIIINISKTEIIKNFE